MADLPAFIRSTHPNSFRSGRWAQVVALDPSYEGIGKPCWLVLFSDGRTDVWLAYDTGAGYEFSETPPVCAVCLNRPLGTTDGPDGRPTPRVCGACTDPPPR